jgi:hypothetical protein
MSKTGESTDERTITYVVAYPGTGLVKIGQAKYYADRFEQLKNGSPIEPEPIYAFLGAHYEGELHRRFSHLRTRGEFFQDAAELRGYLDRSVGRLTHEEALALSPRLPRRSDQSRSKHEKGSI